MTTVRRVPIDLDASVPTGSTNAYVVGRLDILPALKREDSFVGRRAVRRYPEGNFPIHGG